MEYKVFTLNCWGIPFISKDKDERMQAIANALTESQYDVVCLQEVWTDTDFFLIRDKILENLPYSHYFYSGVIGSGVCIFSKHPIIKTHFHKWMLNGYVHKIHHGDWFGGKGVGLCQIKYKHMLINVYSAHLHAEYSRTDDEYYACRLVQAYETAQFVQFTSASADVVILAGDMNCEPGDLSYRMLVDLTSMKDSVNEIEHVPKVSTNLDLKNTYTPNSLKKKQVPGVRIDYILYKSSSTTRIKLLDYFQPLPDHIPTKAVSYSDHEAITSTFSLNRGEVEDMHVNENAQKDVLKEGVHILEKSLKTIQKHKIYYSVLTIVLLCLLILNSIFAQFEAFFLQFINVILSIMMTYTFIMCTIWNKIEYNSLYAAKLGMQVFLNGIELMN